MRGKQKAITQKEQIRQLLETGEPIRDMRLYSLSSDYQNIVSKLRKEGLGITCRITLNGTFYQLNKGESNVAADEFTSLQVSTT